MGASWLEIESLLKQLDDVTAFPHSEALMPVTRARDTVAEAAMIVSRAGISGDPREEAEAQMAMARARVTLHDAQVAVRARARSGDRDPRRMRPRAKAHRGGAGAAGARRGARPPGRPAPGGGGPATADGGAADPAQGRKALSAVSRWTTGSSREIVRGNQVSRKRP